MICKWNIMNVHKLFSRWNCLKQDTAECRHNAMQYNIVMFIALQRLEQKLIKGWTQKRHPSRARFGCLLRGYIYIYIYIYVYIYIITCIFYDSSTRKHHWLLTCTLKEVKNIWHSLLRETKTFPYHIANIFATADDYASGGRTDRRMGALDHYIDVIMTTMASQIPSLTVVYSNVNSDADQRKHQSSASLAFVRGIHRDRLRGKCFHLMTSSCDPAIMPPGFVAGISLHLRPRTN